MADDQRSSKRIYPEGLNAHIVIDPPPPDEEIVIDGIVVDMSYKGIKIRLEQPLQHKVDQGELRISIRLPESGVPMSIHGVIRHVNDDGECGLQYSESHAEHEMDDLMFECVKLAPHSTDE